MERGSGVYGLSGMAGIREAASIRILRPLLSLPKARLRATVNDFGVDVVNDPSNDNSKFDRVRIRRSLTEPKSGPSIAKLYAMTA
jgi:tRNA(Ile)-lysidine synthase